MPPAIHMAPAADRCSNRQWLRYGPLGRPNQEHIDAAVSAYRRYVEPTGEKLDRLEAVMYIRTLYLACFGYRRAVTNGQTFNERGLVRPPEYFSTTAAATRVAFGR